MVRLRFLDESGPARPSLPTGRARVTRWCWTVALAAVAWLAARPARAVSWDQPLAAAVHRSWSTADGLSGSTVSALAQTPDGYIWLGMQTALVRFDGHSFVAFDGATSPVFAHGAWVRALAVDGHGDLWVGTVGSGVIRYHQGEFTAFTTKDGLVSDYIRSIAIGPDDTVWIGTIKGVDALRAGKIVDFPARGRLAGKEAGSLYADLDGSLWIAVPNTGLLWISGAEFRVYDAASGLTAQGAQRVIRDQRGTLLVTSGAGVFYRDGDRFTPIDGSLPDNESTLALAVDHNDTLWMAKAQGGLAIASRGTLKDGNATRAIPTLAHCRIASILEDREGTLWLGTESDGLHALHDGTFQIISPGERPLIVFSALEARDGSLWIGTADSGLVHWRDGDVSVYGEKDGIDGGSVYAIHEDEQGEIWIGTPHTLAKWTGSRFAEVPEVTKEGGRHLVVALSGLHDSLWVAVQGTGLLHFEQGKTHLFTQADGLPSVELTAVHRARDGTVWIGTLAGVARWVDGRIEPLQPPPGSRGAAATYTFYEEESGAVWLGSLAGIGRYQGGTFTMFPRPPTVPEAAFLVGGDKVGNLWVGVGAGAGIYRVAVQDLERSIGTSGAGIRVRSFDESDGLKNREANAGHGPIRLRDGRMAFPTMHGLALVDPAREVHNEAEPTVAIQRLIADDVELRIDGPAALRPGTRHLRIDYAALTYVAPRRVRYRYQLEGYDRGWVEAGAERSAHYANLAPGTYRFTVIAENGDGVVSRAGAHISLRQGAFFYQTVWFYVLSAGIVAAGALGTYRYRIGKVRAVAVMLEKRVDERTNELNEALHELREKDERLQADLRQARTFQQAMLPSLPRGELVSFAALYEPAELVGGDIYDVIETRPGSYRVFLADTTGHGVQASLRTIVIKTEYDRLKHGVASPGALLTALNAALFAHSGGSVRCTACCIDVHSSGNGELNIVYANAAHPEVLILGEPRRSLYSPGMYMGFTADVEYADLATKLRSSEVLVAYSDGATEADAPNGEPWGPEGLAAALTSVLADGLKPDAALRAAYQMIREAAAQQGTASLADDVTMIAIQAPRA